MSTCQVCAGKLDQTVGQKNGYNLFRCPSCGFISVDPMPTSEVLKDHYEKYGGNKKYLNKAEKKIKRTLSRLKRLGSLIPKKGKFIDIGCNVGCAVEAARRFGYEATGIDLDTESISLAKQNFSQNQFEVITSQEMAKKNQKFDVVYCSEVIEHVPDINSFTKSISDMMNKGGILYLTTPDAGHFRTPKNFTSWHEVEPPDHICFFNRHNLAKLLDKYGIKVIKYRFNMKPGIRAIARKV